MIAATQAPPCTEQADRFRCASDVPDPQRLVSQAMLVAVPRPGSTRVSGEDLAAKLGVPAEAVRLQLVDCPQVEIASRDIRARAKAGRSIRFLLPRSVEEFVRERKLYLG